MPAWGSQVPPQRCFPWQQGWWHVALCPCSPGEALPQGGAGAVRDHEEVCPDPGAPGARQVHREPRAWVRGAAAALLPTLPCAGPGGAPPPPHPPPPPANHLRKTNASVVWHVEWAASGFFPLNCVRALCLSLQLTEHSGHVVEVIFFYLKSSVYLLGLCIRGRIKSLYYVCVERLGAGSKVNSLKDTR